MNQYELTQYFEKLKLFLEHMGNKTLFEKALKIAKQQENFPLEIWLIEKLEEFNQ